MRVVAGRYFSLDKSPPLGLCLGGMNSSSLLEMVPPACADGRSEIDVQVVAAPDFAWFDQQMAEHHYLGAGHRVGDYLRQRVSLRGRVAALLVWGPACYALKDRDRWLGWSATHRVERQKLVVQNRRFLVLAEKAQTPNLASQTLAAALRALSEQWLAVFGYRPLLAESFTDPEAHEGTCYKASNWQPVGFSAGYSRHRADFYVPNERPKRLWLFPLDPQARRHLRAAQLPADCQPGVIAPPSGVLPLLQPHVLSLLEVLQRAPDPRAGNTRFRIGAVLTLVAMALLAGRRDIAELARFATTLRPAQRRLLGLPRRKGTRAFYEVPRYGVFYAVLTRLDSEAFATLLGDWLQAHAGTLPQALALDGKMIRDHIGLLTLAQHEDGAPQAVAVYDQKEGTERCEQTAARALLETLPALDDKVVTADALHCQKATARTIVEKGGEDLLQIKANQPGLLAQAQALDALPDTPFLSSRRQVTAGWKCASYRPSPWRPSRWIFLSRAASSSCAATSRSKKPARRPRIPATICRVPSATNTPRSSGRRWCAGIGAEWRSATTGAAMRCGARTARAPVTPAPWPTSRSCAMRCSPSCHTILARPP